MQRRITLAELIDADVPLRPEDAVAIIRDESGRQLAPGAVSAFLEIEEQFAAIMDSGQGSARLD